ncbi:aminoacetone oxidase family FAD-binding enzyme [Acetobacterium paludosum]|uniref:Aminoacetone oxidase family FAD-binding enzyme n=1 Tax=Acetobacterium paludosum TaxID=52693 RepID=A0A923HQP0_9FIRM|nr:NAD(P)/FAD-dependent oxidoreductase [Acetobacterium paludosum]MBC3886958.1 aminoacetone oxidase family FAD-binding enzyme [Acetobacterium paludosum]
MSKIAIIGGGPGGMMAAVAAGDKGHRVDLYESNEKLGKKLYITGKGRCNLTNAIDIGDYFDSIVHNHRFLYSALYSFTNEDFMAFMEKNGVPLKIERGDRVFPVSDKSSDVISGFKTALNKNKCNICLNKKVTNLLIEDGVLKGLVLDDGKIGYYDAVILATGGKSYPSTGSDGNFFKVLKACGHQIRSLAPALVPVNTKENWPRELQGLSLKNVVLTLSKKTPKGQKKIKSILGEMLFTHFGISGPLVLSLSSYISGDPKDYVLTLDLKPGLSIEQMENRIQRDFIKYQNKDFGNALGDLLPSKMIPVMVDLSGIDTSLKVNQITKEQRKKLVQCFKQLNISIADLRDFTEAIITSGGVDVKEVDPGTMESKMIKNLYFAGEMLDVDALTGGYNIQIAVSTGWLAGNSVV